MAHFIYIETKRVDSLMCQSIRKHRGVLYIVLFDISYLYILRAFFFRLRSWNLFHWRFAAAISLASTIVDVHNQMNLSVFFTAFFVNARNLQEFALSKITSFARIQKFVVFTSN